MNYSQMVTLYAPTKAEKDTMAHILVWKERFISQEKRKKGRRIYCSMCNDYTTVTEETYKQIRASSLCPMCHRTFERCSLKKEDTWSSFISVGEFGYAVTAKWQFGKKARLTSCFQCLYDPQNGKCVYTRGIVRSMYDLAITEYDRQIWRKRDAWKYLNYFYSAVPEENYFARGDRVIPTRREFYEAMDQAYFVKEKLKSNQMTFIKKGLFNPNQVKYIIGFDLNNETDVLKYQSYMKKNPFEEPVNALKAKGKINVHLLNYLNANHIPLTDYFDYGVECLTLGYKVDRPKDFQQRHEKYSIMVKAKKNVKVDRQIGLVTKDLKAYEKGDVEIRPFKSTGEILYAAKYLHNCLATYIKRYAIGETLLYRVEVNGKLTAACEVRDGQLIQARLDHNQDYRESPVIKNWCEAMKIERKPTWY